MSSPYPLLFEPVLLPKVWGGTSLAAFNKPLPVGEKIGESWELADMKQTSASGAGGGGVCSTIVNGPLASQSLADAVELWGLQLLGSLKLTDAGGVPLLVKFLDAAENLSLQVHPPAHYVAANPNVHLKTECWYVLDAKPDAVLYVGFKEQYSKDQLRSAMQTGDIVDMMHHVPAVPGRMHLLPSGTPHALGAGVVVAEVQTPSDTTFRMYDWGRTGRELHLEESLDCAMHAPPPPPTQRDGDKPRARLTTTDFFAVDEQLLGAEPTAVASSDECAIVMVIAGDAQLDVQGEMTDLPLGSTCLVPAAQVNQARLQAEGGEARALIVTFP